MKKKWWEKRENLFAIISILAVIFIYAIYVKVSVPVLPSPPCTETDGGDVINVKGNTYNITQNETDYCTANILTEFYCDLNTSNILSTNISCIYGCLDGACFETNQTQCTVDSDCRELSCSGGGFIHEVCINNACTLLEQCPTQNQTNQTCIPSWQEIQEPCEETDTHIIWYKDANNCTNITNKPQNQTLFCDYNNNNIIGNFTQFTDKNVNLKVYIDNKLANISKNFTTEKTIEFREGSLVRIEFDYDFGSELPLNMKIIEIEMQPSDSDFGYIIIKNINQSKTLIIDKLESKSNAVCIKKYEVADIDELSSKCDKTNEYSVKCPGSLGQFSCSISNDTFLVSGVKNSAVKEFIINQTSTSCTPLWSCGSWSSCVNNQQTRTCTDSNSCGVTTGKPNVTQSCTSSPQCTPSWTCNSWQPEKCPKSETQTRNCTDSNSCNIITNKPNESQSCDYEGTSWLFIVVITILGIAILGIIIAIITVAARKQPQQAQKSRISIYGSNPQQQFRRF